MTSPVDHATLLHNADLYPRLPVMVIFHSVNIYVLNLHFKVAVVDFVNLLDLSMSNVVHVTCPRMTESSFILNDTGKVCQSSVGLFQVLQLSRLSTSNFINIQHPRRSNVYFEVAIRGFQVTDIH